MPAPDESPCFESAIGLPQFVPGDPHRFAVQKPSKNDSVTAQQGPGEFFESRSPIAGRSGVVFRRLVPREQPPASGEFYAREMFFMATFPFVAAKRRPLVRRQQQCTNTIKAVSRN